MVPLLTALALSGTAIAADPDVVEGLELYRALEYDRAVVVFGRALAKSALAEDDRREALETLGFAYTVLGDAINGERTFHQLLDLDPNHLLDPALSPRLRDAYQTARSAWAAGRRVEFQLTSALDKRELAGVLNGGDPERVGRVVVRIESESNSPAPPEPGAATAGLAARSAMYCRGRACRGERPDAPFFIDVCDHRGTVLATAGPFVPELGAGDGPPWWVYAAIAAGVLGGGVAVSLAIANRGEVPPGSLGRLQLP